MELIRQTAWEALHLLQLDARTGLETLLVVVKGTFQAGPRGGVVTAEEQAPVEPVDRYRGEPGSSSLAAASDLAPFKASTDVLVEGFGYSTAASRTQALVGLRVGALQKTARVTGERVWSRTLGFGGWTAPQPFARLPLTYERAYGGTDTTAPGHCEENPVGVGFRAKGSKLAAFESRAPNVESLEKPLKAPGDAAATVGFGPVAPDWLPRSRYRGTLDAKWQKEVCPLLPADFDERFHQAAPPDQIVQGYVRGGEPVRLVGTTPEGTWDMQLPTARPDVVVKLGTERLELPCPCDTVLLVPEKKQVQLTWRARLPVQGKVHSLRWVKVEERV